MIGNLIFWLRPWFPRLITALILVTLVGTGAFAGQDAELLLAKGNKLYLDGDYSGGPTNLAAGYHPRSHESGDQGVIGSELFCDSGVSRG